MYSQFMMHGQKNITLIAVLYYLCQRSKCPRGSQGGRIWHRAAGHVLIL